MSWFRPLLEKQIDSSEHRRFENRGAPCTLLVQILIDVESPQKNLEPFYQADETF
jgi:hypothetical protein